MGIQGLVRKRAHHTCEREKITYLKTLRLIETPEISMTMAELDNPIKHSRVSKLNYNIARLEWFLSIHAALVMIPLSFHRLAFIQRFVAGLFTQVD